MFLKIPLPKLFACRGFYELAPLLDYITDILQDVVSDDASTYSNQQLGLLNATYVQSNSNISPEIYASLRTTGAYLPVCAAGCTICHALPAP